MAIRSELYASNGLSQDIALNGIVNFGNVVRKYGCNIQLSGGNATVEGKGYYNVDVNITAAPTTAGTMTVKVFKDGVVVPGASASLTAVADSVYSVTIPATIRQSCCCDSVITVQVQGTPATVSNASIRVVAA